MHELSIALALVDAASETLERVGDVRIACVHIRVGPLSGVVAEALTFSFTAATAGTALDGARLSIEPTTATAWCPRCEGEREIVSIACRRCSACHTIAPRLMRGDELELIGLEIADR